ncbi:response regulator transcription factor [Nocardia testacea]|uniref:response regulator transcription factor n=1 Tax=Nocardia testacea TaxID=248551 RepID=UPI0033CEB3A1
MGRSTMAATRSHRDRRSTFLLAGMSPEVLSDMLDNVNDPYPIRCLIVDDNHTFCVSARSMLEAGGITVVGTASTLDDAVQVAGTTCPDIALVDIDLGGESGFDVVDALHARSTDTRPAIVLMSTHDEEEFSDMIEASAALGFVPKFALSVDRIRQFHTGSPR